MSETATLEGKQGQEWCWAAAARMFAKHYDSNGVPDNLTQRKAVAYAYGKPDTDTSLDTLRGNSYRAQIAMNYYMEQAVVWAFLIQIKVSVAKFLGGRLYKMP